MEAELYSLCEAMKGTKYIYGILGEINRPVDYPVKPYSDNCAAIDKISNNSYRPLTKHVDYPILFTRELIEHGYMEMKWIRPRVLGYDLPVVVAPYHLQSDVDMLIFV